MLRLEDWRRSPVTILNLTVVAVDMENNALLIKGAIPGPKKSIVTIRTAVKAAGNKVEVKEIVNYTAKAE